MDGSNVPAVKDEIQNLLGLDSSKTIAISAKTGKNVHQVIRQIIKLLPAPIETKITYKTLDLHLREFSSAVRKQKDKFLLRQIGIQTTRAYIFDSWFEENKGTFRLLISLSQCPVIYAPFVLLSGGLGIHCMLHSVFLYSYFTFSQTLIIHTILNQNRFLFLNPRKPIKFQLLSILRFRKSNLFFKSNLFGFNQSQSRPTPT